LTFSSLQKGCKPETALLILPFFDPLIIPQIVLDSTVSVYDFIPSATGEVLIKSLGFWQCQISRIKASFRRCMSILQEKITQKLEIWLFPFGRGFKGGSFVVRLFDKGLPLSAKPA